MTDLPESNRYITVVIFVDRLTKYVKFAPTTKEVTTKEYARLCFDNVVCIFGPSKAIVSDRDPRFTGKFWRELFLLMDIKMKVSTARHPQRDEPSEVTIEILENLLLPYIEDHPEAWSKYLKALEYAVNTSVNTTTRYSPHFCCITRSHDLDATKTNIPSI